METNSQMTQQQIFSKVLNGLRKQGHSCKDDQGNCFYFGPNNDRCAVGFLIPDELESKVIKFNDDDFHTLAANIPELKWLLKEELLITELQRAHDAGHFGWFEERMGRIAEEYELEME